MRELKNRTTDLISVSNKQWLNLISMQKEIDFGFSVIEEIKEREQWLKEMEQIGHAEKYRLIIEQQIQNKVREMQKLKSAGDH